MPFDPNKLATARNKFDPSKLNAIKSGQSMTQPQSLLGTSLRTVYDLNPVSSIGKIAPYVGKAMDWVNTAGAINVSPEAQRVLEVPFNVARGIGVGTAVMAAGKLGGLGGGVEGYVERGPKGIFPGMKKYSDPIYSGQRAMAAMKRDYIPQGPIETLGATVGEAAPTVGASVYGPWTGSMVYAAQQAAREGKVGPIPLALGQGGWTSGLVGKVAGKASKPLFPMATWTGKRLASGVLGPDVKAMEMRYSTPELLEKARPYQDLGSDLAATLTKIKNEAIDETDAAWDALTTLKATPRSSIQKIARKIQSEFKVTGGGPVGSENRRAFDEMENLIADIRNIKQKGIDPELEQFLDQTQIKELIKSADLNAQWDNPYPGAREIAYRKFRGKLNEMLRDESPEYAQVMDPISKKIKLVEELSGSFGLKPQLGGNLTPSDVTAGKFPLFLDEKRSATRMNLEKLKQLTGKDYPRQAELYKYARQFQEGATRPQGSRRVNLSGAVGAGAGGLVGGVPGGILGAMVGGIGGAYLDTQGGAIAGKAIDALRKNQGNIRQLGENIKSTTKATGRAIQRTPVIGGIIGNILTNKKAKEYLKLANGDKKLAREMATSDGWRIPKK